MTPEVRRPARWVRRRQSVSGRPFDTGLQNERTGLAWQRTALSLTVTGLIAARFVASSLPVVAIVLTTATLAVWGLVTVTSSARYRISHTALHEGVPLPDGRVHCALSLLVILVGAATLTFLLSSS